MLIGVQESGHDLGVAARGKLAKNVESMLDLAVVIGKAYDLYYAPRAKRGRPKGSQRLPHEVEMDKQWAAFLAASGYEIPRDARLLRSHWRVSKRAGFLRKYSENLPNSLDALAELSAEEVKDQELFMVVEDLQQQNTADDVRLLIKASQLVPLNEIEGVDDMLADYQRCQAKKRFKGAVARQRELEVSAGLLTLPPIEVTRENMARVALLTMVARKLGFPVGTKAELQEALGEDFAQISGTLGGAYWWQRGVEDGIERLVRDNAVEPYLEAVMEAA
jgi:hypothetical protein